VDSNRQQRLTAAFPIIERIYQEHAQRNRLPGLAFGLVLDSTLVYSGAVGYTDVQRKTPATPRSLFRIASMTKSMTAAAVLMLRDQGKLNLDDPAEKFIPEMKRITPLTADAAKITIRHLLTHTAGFPEDNPWGDRQLAATDQELIALIVNGISLANVPGVAYEYSNLGFALLGKIVANVSGMSYQQFVMKNLFQPLGMSHSVWEYRDAPVDQLAHGYQWQAGGWKEVTLLHDGSYASMGGLITSIEDFSRYMIFHLSAWPPRNTAPTLPLSSSSLREMQQPWSFNKLKVTSRSSGGPVCPMVSAYGFGLRWEKDCQGKVFIGHGGGLPGFGSQWRMLPDYGMAVVALSNLTYADLGPANDAVLDTCIALAGLTPRPVPVSAVLQQRSEELVRLLPDWNVTNPDLFGDNFFQDQSLDVLRRAFKRLYAQAGKIIAIKEIVAENQLRGSFILVGEKANIELFFTLTPQRPARIQSLRYQIISRTNQGQAARD